VELQASPQMQACQLETRPMADKPQPRENLTTRISIDALEVIERVAAARRTTPSQVARVLLEDAAKQLASDAQAA
jgi:hypothetical protein